MNNREIKFRAWDEFPRYEIGSDGSVWSNDFNHTGNRKALRQYLDDDGYPYVQLVVGGKRYKRIVHRMVAKCFVENTENKPQVNHKNGIRSDNRSENLEWVTPRENTIHGYRVNGRQHSEKQRQHGRESFGGTNNPKAKINEATALSIRRLRAKGELLRDIAKQYGLSTSQVSAIATGKSWKS